MLAICMIANLFERLYTRILWLLSKHTMPDCMDQGLHGAGAAVHAAAVAEVLQVPLHTPG
jgi:hypothetical protein